MSSIVVAGDTSGSITLQAPGVAGSAVLTLPTASGTVVATDLAGNVGIGTSSPTAKLQVNGGTAQYSSGIAVRSGTNQYEWGHTNTAGYGSVIGMESGSGIPFIGFSCGGGTTSNTYRTYGLVGSVISSDNAGGVLFRTVVSANADNQTPIERMRIDSSGNVTLQKNISVGSAAPTTSGSGITFPATQSASSDANTLDDYEEGTWTPNVYNASSSSTFTQKIGSYRKIGAVVHCWFVCDWGNSGTAGSALQLTGFPFTINSPGGAISVGIWGANGLSPTTGNILTFGSILQIYYGGGSISSSTSYISGYFSYPTI